MKDMERKILDYLKGLYNNDKEEGKYSEEVISFFFQGIFNGINLCISQLNCEVSEEFSIECVNLLNEIIKEYETKMIEEYSNYEEEQEIN